MDREAGRSTKVRAEYLRFFESLGVVDQGKVHTLGRLLHTFYEVAAQLDTHLASVGAALHSAISRMTETDNPSAPPRHRWIRVVDRLGFFPDQDQHASRIVNMGLAYAYRHKELDLVTAANALLLRNKRPLVPVNDGGGNTLTPPEVVPVGGIAVPRVSGSAGTRPPAGSSAALPAGGGPDAADPLMTNATGGNGADVGEGAVGDDDLVLPPGGLIVPRPGALDGAAETAAVGAGTGRGSVLPKDGDESAAPAVDEISDGGVVVVRPSPSPGNAAQKVARNASGASPSVDPSETHGQALAVVAVDEPQAKVVLTSQPVITPSPAAVQCIVAVLESVMDRGDAREVLYQLLGDSLLCLTRLHGGAVLNRSPGAVQPSVELDWVRVRTHLYRWWPIWRAPAGEAAPVPVPGTVGFISHPTRAGRVSRWALDVDMSCVNETIKRLSVRASVLGGLPSVVSVTRVGPSVRSSLPLSVATLLLVASKEDRFCDVLRDLASLGRAPAPTERPIVTASCHDFETAELGAPEVIQPGGASLLESIGGGPACEDDATEPAVVSDGLDVAALDAVESTAVAREQRYAEMEKLLAEEKERDAVATRAHRVAMRRLARPVGAAALSPARPTAAHPVVATVDLLVSPVGPTSSAKRRRLGPGDQGGHPDGNPGDQPDGVPGGPPGGLSGGQSSGPRPELRAFAHLLPKRRPSKAEALSVGRAASATVEARSALTVDVVGGGSPAVSGGPVACASGAAPPTPAALPPRLSHTRSSDSSSASSSDYFIASRVPLLAATRNASGTHAATDRPSPSAAAAPFPTAAERERSRQRVAASVAAMQASLAAVHAERHPLGGGPLMSDSAGLQAVSGVALASEPPVDKGTAEAADDVSDGTGSREGV